MKLNIVSISRQYNQAVTLPAKEVRYVRGCLPLGKIVAARQGYIGNTMNGWSAFEVIVKDKNGLWVCYPQPTQVGDYASYRLLDDSPEFVKKTASNLLAINKNVN